MTCNEKGCATTLTVANAFVDSLGAVAEAAGKAVIDLTAEELLLVAECDECAALHIMCGEARVSASAALAEIERLRADRDGRAAAKRAARAAQQAAADRAASRTALGAGLLALGLHPSRNFRPVPGRPLAA